MMKSSVLEAVVKRLSRYDGLRIKRGPQSLIVLAESESEFDIRIQADGDGLAVWMGDWHREFNDLESAWNVIAVGLSDGSRLRIEPDKHGRSQCWLEILLPDSSWRTLPEVDKEPDRLNPSVYYRQNTYLRAYYTEQAAYRRAS